MSLAVILNRLNLTDDEVAKFSKFNIKTVLDFLHQDNEELKRKLQISDQLIENIKDLIYSEYASTPVLGTDLYEETFRLTKILSTGCENLDSLLNGGLYTREMTEVYGPPAAGKTQFALWLSYHVISTLPVNAVYIDTTGSFVTERFFQFFESDASKTMEKRMILSKLQRVRLLNAVEVMAFLYQLKRKLATENDEFCLRIKLIVLDSIASVITPILNSETKEGYMLMSKIGIMLKEIAYEYGISVLVLNNAVSNYFDKTKMTTNVHNPDKYKPTLGVTWLPMATVRLFIERVEGEVRKVRIDKHSRLKTRGVTHIRISRRGVSNA